MRASRLPEGFGKEDSENEGGGTLHLSRQLGGFEHAKIPKKTGSLCKLPAVYSTKVKLSDY
jgi:hypothetical protein